MPGGTLRGLEDHGGVHLASPLPNQAPGSLKGSWAGSSTLRGPFQDALVLGA